MATITTDTYLDGGTSRTAGETWTINNGATLTIRTDTRWHANSPASMTGSLGNITLSASLGGGFTIDGTKVRWMPFDTGSSVVPAIGTTITKGGVSGYLLGVWADLSNAPTAVGASMPSTGFIKFREVTGGTFSSGALTGISANSTGADVAGWIEIVLDQGTTTSNSAVGSGIQATGDWFYLDNTTGSRGQVLQVPTNGGGSTTTVLGVQIETSAGSGVYEWFPALNSTGWATNALTTDSRAKFVQSLGSGQVRIGNDGTNSIGYLPASGCKVRVPNIFIRQCTTGARATNAAPSTTATTRPQYSFPNGGSLTLSKVMSDMYISPAATGEVSITDTVVDLRLGFTAAQKSITLTRVAVSSVSTLQQTALFISNAKKGFTCTDSVFCVTANLAVIAPTYLANASISNTKFVSVFNKASSNTVIASLSQSSAAFDSCKFWGGRVAISSCDSITFTNSDYIDRTSGDMQTVYSAQAFDISASSNILVDGLTYGDSGTLSNCAQYGSIVNTSNGVNNIKVRNIGSYASPLSTNSNSANYPVNIITTSSNDSNIKVQRVYLTGTRTGIASILDYTCGNVLLEHIYGTLSNTTSINGSDLIVRSCGVSTAATTHANTLGSHWLDSFTSTTAGQILLYFNQASSTTSAYASLSAATGSGLSGDGSLRLRVVSDVYTIEMPYFVKGHTALANTSPTLTGTNTGNHTIEYQIDTGSGWNGTWKTLNATNLSGETITSTIGFKLKIRITCATGSTTNALSCIKIVTVSTSSAQTTELFPLDTVSLGFTNLVVGSEVRCYTGTNPDTSVEIGGVESTSGSTFSFTHAAGGTAGYIMIFALGYQPIYLPYTFASTDTSLLIQQVVDRNYVNP